ncbi:hypothetical protein [Ferviditalea candida]|uniref:Uncharacterized protein n=1 Tax=Ferviditalea candida TaxID=3108399 RepID=A0ABU5ZK10_9BACL|nr:hypothetical protein [Paenibacillaceae bacterium T2]
MSKCLAGQAQAVESMALFSHLQMRLSPILLDGRVIGYVSQGNGA